MKAKIQKFPLLGCASPRNLSAAVLFASIAILVLSSTASAAVLDFNVANGNYNVASNWIDTATGLPPASPPTVVDNAYVRNGGTLNINTDVANLQMRIGYVNVVTAPDYNGDGFVDAADYVAWRKGGTLQNDATPADVGQDDYTLWKRFYGAPAGTQNIGQPGTLNWTAGEITGTSLIGGDPFSGGPDIRVGRIELVNGVPTEVTGTVVQNGPTTKLLLPFRQSQLTIGDGTSFTHTPTSSYTLMDGTIGHANGNDNFQNDGSNGNNGILVRNGTFNMTGGQIIDVTPAAYLAEPAGTLNAQRFLTIGTATGGGVGNESVATANLSGGTINVLGGIRMATANHSRAYLNINGPVTIVTGGDTHIGYQPNTGGINAVAEMNMSAGSLQVGRNDTNPVSGVPYGLTGRFQVGDRGKGILNMSGGSITATRNVRVTNEIAAAGSFINMTGGTITTPGFEMRVTSPGAFDTEIAASIIIDGPTANFITTGGSNSVIGNHGKALFEVRQGNAVIGGGGSTIQVGNGPLSSAIINVKGGKLTLAGPVTRTTLTSAAPVVGLTGGTLEFNNTTTSGAHVFHADLINTGTQLVTKPNAVQSVQVGGLSPAVPANFAMSSGSWNIDIGQHSVTGADSFNVPNGTASLTGGTLNINYLPGFTPNPNEVFTILTGASGVTLNSGAVAITGTGSPNWTLQTAGTNIQLKYTGAGSGGGGGVPEPSTVVLLGLFATAQLASRRARRSER